MSDALDLWARCGPGLNPVEIAGELLRLVESQEQVATSSLVDDLAEQALLEDLLERAKPPSRPGSRFGSRFEPSVLYGALSLRTILAESAYHRLVFWTAMAEPPPAGRLLTQHTLFRVRYRSPSPGWARRAPPVWSTRAELGGPSTHSPLRSFS